MKSGLAMAFLNLSFHNPLLAIKWLEGIFHGREMQKGNQDVFKSEAIIHFCTFAGIVMSEKVL